MQEWLDEKTAEWMKKVSDRWAVSRLLFEGSSSAAERRHFCGSP